MYIVILTPTQRVTLVATFITIFDENTFDVCVCNMYNNTTINIHGWHIKQQITLREILIYNYMNSSAPD